MIMLPWMPTSTPTTTPTPTTRRSGNLYYYSGKAPSLAFPCLPPSCWENNSCTCFGCAHCVEKCMTLRQDKRKQKQLAGATSGRKGWKLSIKSIRNKKWNKPKSRKNKEGEGGRPFAGSFAEENHLSDIFLNNHQWEDWGIDSSESDSELEPSSPFSMLNSFRSIKNKNNLK